MVRSIFLRGFDQEMANKIANYMKNHGVKFLKKTIPSNIETTEDNKRKVTWQTKNGE